MSTRFVRPREARAIVEAGRVLPLLDGLDELPAGAAAAALPMINRAGFQRPLGVACRTLEFARAVHAGDVLTGGAVVELEPVRPDRAEVYLHDTTPQDDRLARWEPVFAELRRGSGSPLAAALSTPLMVTQARTVYALDRRADPARIRSRTLASRGSSSSGRRRGRPICSLPRERAGCRPACARKRLPLQPAPRDRDVEHRLADGRDGSVDPGLREAA